MNYDLRYEPRTDGPYLTRVQATAQDGSGIVAFGGMVTCPCGSREFQIVHLDGSDHPHLCCILCGLQFCSGGTCK
jgi:hypothetical protein